MSMHKRLESLKAEVMRVSTDAVVNGLPPLGALTATLAAVEEQVAAMYRGVMLAEIIAPSGDGRLEEYHTIITELLRTTSEHVAELRKLAATGAEQEPLRQAAREIEKLESMMADPRRTQKPS